MKFDINKVAKALVELINKSVDQRFDTIAKLERRIEELEKNKKPVDFDILEEIDISKSYPPNTFARYKSGLVKSVEDTIPLCSVEQDEGTPFDKIDKCGWVCIVSGCDGVDYEFDEEQRCLKVKTFYTDITLEHNLDIPVVLDRGVYNEEVEYKKGDAVSYQGSLWICRSSSTKSRPSTSNDWRLSVKRG